MNLRASSLVAALVAAAFALAANGPPLAGAWNIAATGARNRAVTCDFRITHNNGSDPVDITVPVNSGAKEDSAWRAASAMRSARNCDATSTTWSSEKASMCWSAIHAVSLTSRSSWSMRPSKRARRRAERDAGGRHRRSRRNPHRPCHRRRRCRQLPGMRRATSRRHRVVRPHCPVPAWASRTIRRRACRMPRRRRPTRQRRHQHPRQHRHQRRKPSRHRRRRNPDPPGTRRIGARDSSSRARIPAKFGG